MTNAYEWFPYLRWAHLIGMYLWIGTMPCEQFLVQIALRSPNLEARRRAAGWATTLLSATARMGIAALVLSGAGLLWLTPRSLANDGLLQLKLAMVAVVFAVELLLIHRSVRRADALLCSSAGASESAMRLLRGVVGARAVIVVLLAGLVFQSLPGVGWDWKGASLVIAAFLAIYSGTLWFLRRAAVGVGETLPSPPSHGPVLPSHTANWGGST